MNDIAMSLANQHALKHPLAGPYLHARLPLPCANTYDANKRVLADVDDNRFIDAPANHWMVNVGHAEIEGYFGVGAQARLR